METLKTPSVPSLERALSILELLAESTGGLTLPELAKALQLPKSSVHCILLTLERREYLNRQASSNRYLFGAKLFALSNTALNGIELRECALPFMQDLSAAARLTTHMAILDRNEAVLIAKVEAPGIIRLATWVGKRMDAHCTGVGKALIAFLPDDQLKALILDRGLPRHNDNTIASARRLKEEVGRIRAQGYSTEDEEDEVGLRCIGAPIFDNTGRVVAAISLSGTTEQITSDNLQHLVTLLKHCSAAVSRSLGFDSR